MAPIIGIIASGNWAGANASSYESIATVTVGSGGSSSVEFTSIPSTYTHLQIRALVRTNRSGGAVTDNIRIQFNNDTTSSYTRHELWGDGGGAYAYGAGSESSGYAGMLCSTASSSANVFGGGTIDILDAFNTSKYKTTRTLGGTDNNGSGGINFSSSVWQKTNAITSIKLFGEIGGTIQQYSSFALYGIKS